MAYTTIDDPTAYFQTKLYTGTRANLNVTFDGNSDMSPNLVWVKDRTNTNNQIMFDSVRGINKAILPNAANAETTYTDSVTAFNSDGFTLGDDDEGQCNVDGNACASWNWKAGTSFTNDASSTGIGSIDSAGSFNNDSGFSIVSYTGTGSNGTIKHGLNTAPSMIIFKNRSSVKGWSVYHKSIGATKFLFLNETSAEQTYTPMFNNTEPTSSVFSVGTDLATNVSGNNYIAYCFAEKQGYSKFGSYTGNGSTDGPFVYTGFKPAFVITKRTDSTGSWGLNDNKRPNYNPENLYLVPNDAQAEASDGSWTMDLLSNGWKARYNNGNFNASGGSYIYMAFAENPFVTSTGVPTTAR